MEELKEGDKVLINGLVHQSIDTIKEITKTGNYKTERNGIFNTMGVKKGEVTGKVTIVRKATEEDRKRIVMRNIKHRIKDFVTSEKMEEVPYEFTAIVHTLLTKYSEINMTHKDGRISIEFK
jgi:hypothetical protein